MPFDSHEFVQRLEEAVQRKKTGGVICPLCSNTRWQLPGGYVVSSLQNEIGGIHIGGPGIPKVPMICANCGFVAEIAIGVLGLLPKEEVQKSPPVSEETTP
jgi:hypothetical protein